MPKFNSDSARIAGSKSSRKGVPNKATSETRSRLDLLVSENFDRYQEELNSLNGKDYVQAYHQMLEYVLPKLQRVETSTSLDIDEMNEKQLNQVIESIIDLDEKTVNILDLGSGIEPKNLPSWMDEGKE